MRSEAGVGARTSGGRARDGRRSGSGGRTSGARPVGGVRAAGARTARWATALLLIATACDSPQNVLDPRGPAAARIDELWWPFLVMGVGVSVIVIFLLLLAIRRSRQRAATGSAGEVNGRTLVVLGAGVASPIILFFFLIYSFRVGVDVYAPLVPGDDAFTVEVVGHQYWWEVRYPEQGIVSANELHIPAGRPVRVLLEGEDVIHSFWVPQLHGKIDMIPGHITEIWLQADEPGAFRGQCAEYCGTSHALMAFWVVAHAEDDFEAWVDRRVAPTLEPVDEEVRRGREVFFQAECHLCHATRGQPTPAGDGPAGPDLTHLASRRTLGAGTLPNTRGSLAGWISDPGRIKPGVRMPPTYLPPEDLRALLAYLESLE